MSPQADPAGRDLVAAILASATPDAALLNTLEQLDRAGDTVMQARVFETLMWRMNPGEYWVWFRMCQAYQDLKRPESGLFCAARALQIHPDWEPSLFLYRTLFAHFRQRGELAAAFDVLLRQRRSLPGAQLLPAHELAALFGEDHTSAEAGSAAPMAEMASVLARLETVMRAVFHLPDLRIQPEMTADDVPGWDSIAHAVLLMEVERAFGVTFDAAEALDLESVGALAGLLGRKLTPPPTTAMRPKIIVYGNCQAGALAAMLARTPAVSRRFAVVQHDLWAAGETLAAI